MLIETYVLGPLQTNCYLVACDKTGLAAVIDPGMGALAFIKKSVQEKNLRLSAIYLTHSHWDHIVDVAPIHKSFSTPIYLHKEDKKNLQNPGSDGLPLLFSVPKANVDIYLEEGKKIALGDLAFEVIHTPGHSPGSVCLFEPTRKILFSGDTLFKGSIGNVHFAHSSSKNMITSLQKLEKLPKDTLVYPGHGDPTKLDKENWLPKAKELFHL